MIVVSYFLFNPRAEKCNFHGKTRNSRAESPKALSSGQSVSVAPSEAIPHYFRTIRAKALNMADFWQTKTPICPTETPFRKNKTASYFANSPF